MRRLRHLDAIRGLAALLVMLHHAWLSLPSSPLPRDGYAIRLLGVVALGRPAVVLFFVLSGYVLTLALQASRFAPVGFAVRRLLRILLPYWVAVALAFVLYLCVPRHPICCVSPWLSGQWSSNVSPAGVAQHLLLIAGPHQFPLDHVAWSLVHELRLSLLLPFMVLLSRRAGVVTLLMLATAVTCGADMVIATFGGAFPRGIHGFLFDAEGLGPSLVLSARFTLFFALGSAAATCGAGIAELYAPSSLCRIAAFAAAAILLSQRDETAMCVGAVLLITAAASSATLERALAAPACVWLGRVSYSLYLVHLPIMLACAAWLGGAVPTTLLLVLAMVVALVAADVLFRLVERPSILLSRTAGATIQPKWPKSAAASAEAVEVAR